MRAKEALKKPDPTEPTLDQEISVLGEDDLLEFMNLTERQTGIGGIVFVSTMLGSHGPRVKFFLKPGRHAQSFSVSIEEHPRVLANSLSERAMRSAAPSVVEWVKLNRAALLDLWTNGTSWTHDEINTFVAGLQKLPR
jgi:hypothetical protein